jgi:hypothetical protein
VGETAEENQEEEDEDEEVKEEDVEVEVDLPKKRAIDCVGVDITVRSFPT